MKRKGEPRCETVSQVLDVVRRQPGISVQGVAKAVGRQHSTVDYHLWQLVHAREIVRVRSGRCAAFFVNGIPPERRKWFLLGESERRLVLELQSAGEPLSGIELSRRLGVSIQSVRWSLAKAQELGLARRARHGHFEAVVA